MSKSVTNCTWIKRSYHILKITDVTYKKLKKKNNKERQYISSIWNSGNYLIKICHNTHSSIQYIETGILSVDQRKHAIPCHIHISLITDKQITKCITQNKDIHLFKHCGTVLFHYMKSNLNTKPWFMPTFMKPIWIY